MDTSALPSICQRGGCYRDAVKKTNYCSAHQPKPRRKLPAWTGRSVVYMVGVEGEPFIKVGFASELSSRMVGMQVGSPKKLLVLAVFPGCKKAEAMFHRELQDHHVRGEWFDYAAARDLALRLEASRELRGSLLISGVISQFKADGHEWDCRGLSMTASRKSKINHGLIKI